MRSWSKRAGLVATVMMVVALFAADKAKLGDVFYDGVAARADPVIDQWKRETAYEEKP